MKFDGSDKTVIIVGPDGVGKTPIAQALAAKSHGRYFKCSMEHEIFRAGGKPETLWFDLILTQLLQQTQMPIVSDRGYPCEFAYSRAFDRKTNENLLGKIDAEHADLGTVIVHLYSSVLPTKEDELVSSDMYWKINDQYLEFARWSACEVITYDTSKSADMKYCVIMRPNGTTYSKDSVFVQPQENVIWTGPLAEEMRAEHDASMIQNKLMRHYDGRCRK